MAGVGIQYLQKNADDNFGGWFFLTSNVLGNNESTCGYLQTREK